MAFRRRMMMNFRFGREDENSHGIRTGWMMTALASLPLFIYVRDRIGCICRVRGNSMHPTLQDGDIVWVKKCSLLPWMSLFGNNKKHDHLLLVEKEEKEDGNNDFMNHQQQHAAEQEKARLIRYERMHGIVHPPGWFLQSIIPIPGQIIAYQNPYNPHREYIVQRVIGVGGQWIQRNAGSGSNNNNNIHSYRFELLPIYNVFVEGDNQDHHPHSPFSEGRTVSRNLVTGVVETILWPPSRWQTIHHTTSNNNNNNNNKNHHPSWKDRARWT